MINIKTKVTKAYQPNNLYLAGKREIINQTPLNLAKNQVFAQHSNSNLQENINSNANHQAINTNQQIMGAIKGNAFNSHTSNDVFKRTSVYNSLKRGQKTLLGKISELNNIDVIMIWNKNNLDIDIDTSCFLLDDEEKVIGDDWFVYYNQPVSPDNSVKHLGDGINSKTINISLSKLNKNVKKIMFVLTIDEARRKNLNFKYVDNVIMKIIDKVNNKEIAVFDLPEHYENITSMMIGEIYRYKDEWKVNPIGDGTNDDLEGLCRRYKVAVE